VPVPAGYRLLEKFPMPVPSGLHKWFKKKLPCLHGMTKSQYRPTLVLSSLMTSDLFATMQEKILFHAITSHEHFFSFQQTKAKISYV